MGDVENVDGFMSTFSKSCGKARPHRGFPQDVSFHSRFSSGDVAQQMLLVFGEQFHIQIPRRLDPVLVCLDRQGPYQP